MLNQFFATGVLLVEIATRLDTADFYGSAALVLNIHRLRIASETHCRGIPP
jgi:hypothetical protein